jgi:hypothetical protein
MKRGALIRRRQKESTSLGAAAAVTLALGALVGAVLLPDARIPLPYVAAPPLRSNVAVASPLEPEGLALRVGDRPTFRYSVIPGGAYSGNELREALANDPVAAEHHRDVNLDSVHRETSTAPRMVYVSYRIGDEIAWTKHPVLLPAGEALLTDGVNEIRARCGNAVSDVARGPTSDQEPDLATLDTISDPGMYALVGGAPEGAPGGAPQGTGGGAPRGLITGLTGGVPSLLSSPDAAAGSAADPVFPDVMPGVGGFSAGGQSRFGGAALGDDESSDDQDTFNSPSDEFPGIDLGPGFPDGDFFDGDFSDGSDGDIFDESPTGGDFTDVTFLDEGPGGGGGPDGSGDLPDGDSDEGDTSGGSDNPPIVIPPPDGDPDYPVDPTSDPSDGPHDPDPPGKTDIPSVPEPTTISLIGLSLAAVAARKLRTRRNRTHASH